MHGLLSWHKSRNGSYLSRREPILRPFPPYTWKCRVKPLLKMGQVRSGLIKLIITSGFSWKALCFSITHRDATNCSSAQPQSFDYNESLQETRAAVSSGEFLVWHSVWGHKKAQLFLIAIKHERQLLPTHACSLVHTKCEQPAWATSITFYMRIYSYSRNKENKYPLIIIIIPRLLHYLAHALQTLQAILAQVIVWHIVFGHKRKKVLLILLWLYSPLLRFDHFFRFLTLYTVGRTLWAGEQPVARPLPTHRTT
jgi:hypothetical protein